MRLCSQLLAAWTFQSQSTQEKTKWKYNFIANNLWGTRDQCANRTLYGTVFPKTSNWYLQLTQAHTCARSHTRPCTRRQMYICRSNFSLKTSHRYLHSRRHPHAHVHTHTTMHTKTDLHLHTHDHAKRILWPCACNIRFESQCLVCLSFMRLFHVEGVVCYVQEAPCSVVLTSRVNTVCKLWLRYSTCWPTCTRSFLSNKARVKSPE